MLAGHHPQHHHFGLDGAGRKQPHQRQAGRRREHRPHSGLGRRFAGHRRGRHRRQGHRPVGHYRQQQRRCQPGQQPLAIPAPVHVLHHRHVRVRLR
ncbi:hypothetical protein G6F32_016570 [Rhizopus arrhizus]|nr:hypothetical protein G6F32_016570 [Rhizopus arrhizus]